MTSHSCFSTFKILSFLSFSIFSVMCLGVYSLCVYFAWSLLSVLDYCFQVSISSNWTSIRSSFLQRLFLLFCFLCSGGPIWYVCSVASHVPPKPCLFSSFIMTYIFNYVICSDPVCSSFCQFTSRVNPFRSVFMLLILPSIARVSNKNNFSVLVYFSCMMKHGYHTILYFFEHGFP